MHIDMPRRKPPGESIIPMINVVFLLLIFFLLTAQISPSTPFPLTPPDSSSDETTHTLDVLYISATGDLAWNEARGEAVWPLIADRQDNAPVQIRADATTPAAMLAAHLKHLRSVTDSGAQLVVNKG
ncbi:biopolymer transporter ExbD [Paracoccus sp. JM45]|uniref:biopolymer transporter ExbD n=1 Tax=Paracoccus sp. JM45 TaxID=2283626 RepID=UPI000E6C66CC|nr:biopolymer transporter ExbD [Paracoccus sp. JM45]RJE80844.1 biopolymer transporter ExbD [Paracoccus sp. JM45]